MSPKILTHHNRMINLMNDRSDDAWADARDGTAVLPELTSQCLTSILCFPSLTCLDDRVMPAELQWSFYQSGLGLEQGCTDAVQPCVPYRAQ
jgi:hypothetical protein